MLTRFPNLARELISSREQLFMLPIDQQNAILNEESRVDAIVLHELSIASIPMVRHEHLVPGEVPTRLTGEFSLYEITFRRFWYYWVMHSETYLSNEILIKLYADVELRSSLRADGNCVPEDPIGRRVNCYHIDTQEALNYFVRIINENHKEHGR